MKTSSVGAMMAAALLTLGSVGCSHLPGKPGFSPETLRPDQKLGFTVLYQSNCSGCHGDSGLNGAALPLNNPVYLTWAGREHLIQIVAKGVPQSAMPAFGRSGGGMLTDEQVERIVDGMIARWEKPDILNNTNAPAYAPTSKGDPAQGKAAFQIYCARCHGADGQGAALDEASAGPFAAGSKQAGAIGSIVDPTYLALITDQGLRDIVVSGLPGEGMPNWHGDGTGKPIMDQNVADIVAWLASQRVQFPGQPFSRSRQ
jgi:cytochrome c oxidase cbb3-type subunit 3/ubiquinol-cytochrome c reductase cytochrome c subunit